MNMCDARGVSYTEYYLSSTTWTFLNDKTPSLLLISKNVDNKHSFEMLSHSFLILIICREIPLLCIHLPKKPSYETKFEVKIIWYGITKEYFNVHLIILMK